MKWSPEQDRALGAVAAWLRAGDRQVFRLFGYAGTGKTTLARHVAEGVTGATVFAAFTGKAAHVLRSKGCVGAGTIHSLIYRMRGEDEDGPTFVLNDDSMAGKAGLIVIDECSMVDAEIGRDLLSFGTPVLVLGDPAQLPPIAGGGFFICDMAWHIASIAASAAVRSKPASFAASSRASSIFLPAVSISSSVATMTV